jgi:hypothetical protein
MDDPRDEIEEFDSIVTDDALLMGKSSTLRIDLCWGLANGLVDFQITTGHSGEEPSVALSLTVDQARELARQLNVVADYESSDRARFDRKRGEWQHPSRNPELVREWMDRRDDENES